MKKTRLITSVFASSLALTACGPQNDAPELTQTITGAATPASEYCVSQGGTSEIRAHNDGSQYRVCVFASGEEIDEQEFFRVDTENAGDKEFPASGEALIPNSGTTTKSSKSPSHQTIGKGTQTLTGNTTSSNKQQSGNIEGLANPASEYCVKQGGKSENRKDKDGNQYGVCILPDGEEIDERAFFRLQSEKPVGLANPASEYCVKQGGTLEIRKNKDGSEYGVCKLKNGQEREERNYFRGSAYLGLTTDQAKALADKNGVAFRIIEEDGKSFAITMDLRPGRVNATITKGKVTDVNIE